MRLTNNNVDMKNKRRLEKDASDRLDGKGAPYIGTPSGWPWQDYLQQTLYLTLYIKLHCANNATYNTKQYFAQPFTRLAGDGRATGTSPPNISSTMHLFPSRNWMATPHYPPCVGAPPLGSTLLWPYQHFIYPLPRCSCDHTPTGSLAYASHARVAQRDKIDRTTYPIANEGLQLMQWWSICLYINELINDQPQDGGVPSRNGIKAIYK